MNADYQTSVPNIYRVGDVIGFPSLASTSIEQGRHAACHAVNVHATHMPELFPYGIYTIPELSMVGPTEEELTEKGVPVRGRQGAILRRSPAGRSSATAAAF